MFSKYNGCNKHITNTSNFSPSCSKCWKELRKSQEREEMEDKNEKGVNKK